MSAWQIFGTIAFPVFLACFAIYLTHRFNTKSTQELIKSTNKMIEDARQRGVECIEHDLKSLGKSTVEVIEADGKETRNAIEATIKAIQVDGQQTRDAIKAIVKKQ